MSKILLHVSCVLLCLSIITHHGDTQSQNVPGGPGRKGRKGDRGGIGPPGPYGLVGYDRIEAAVLEHVSPEINFLTANLNSLIRSVDEMKARLDMMDISNTEFCDVVYNGKCFHAMLHKKHDVDFNEAREMCESIGGSLANIYDSFHQAKIANYLRRTIPSTRNWVAVWTGMTINPGTKVVSLAFGTEIDASERKWHPGYPKSLSGWTYIGFNVKRDPDENMQGLHDFPEGYERHGALCEK